MRSKATAVRFAAALVLLLPLLALLPGASAHGFAGFEVSGVRTLEPSGQENASYVLSKHGEAEWHFEVSFSAGAASGNGTRLPVVLRIEHGLEVLEEYRGVSGALSAPTADAEDYYINWTNPNPERVELRFRVALIGPPTPMVLWAILACGVAVLTATVLVLVIDGLHSVARGEVAPRYEGQVKASYVAKAMKEEDAKRSGKEEGLQKEAESMTAATVAPTEQKPESTSRTRAAGRKR